MSKFELMLLALAVAVVMTGIGTGPVVAADAERRGVALTAAQELAQRGEGRGDDGERRQGGGKGRDRGGSGTGEAGQGPRGQASDGERRGNARKRADRVIEMNDKDGDGRISRDEWPRRPDAFKKIDADKDGHLSKDELQAWFADPDRKGGAGGGGGPRLDGQVSRDALDEATRCGITRSKKCDIKIAIKRGLFETGLRPAFPVGLSCRGIDEGWAISYSQKRPRENYHGGIDMPAPWGTPMHAAAAGTVVAKSYRQGSFRGIEIIVRHSPQETGLPVWTYTQYAHFDKIPDIAVGARVRMGQNLGQTGNSGATMSNKKDRRPAIHFAVWFSQSPNFANIKDIIIPVDGWWMDPIAFYRKGPPFDSAALKALPAAEKNIPIPVMLVDGTTIPVDTKVMWPYTCKRN